ncbi:MAG: hypothetical protein ABIH23_06890 [bacterium]
MIAAPAFCQTRNANPQAVGLEVLIPDTVAFPLDVDNAANLEPYADCMGDGTLMFVCGTKDVDGNYGTERPGAVFIRPDMTVIQTAGYFADDGTPWDWNIDTVRPDGNPPQCAGIRTPGATRYAVGMESTPYNEPDSFNTDGRWKNEYTDHFYCVQIFDLTANGPVKVTNVIDPFYGEMANLSIPKGRCGGVAGLDNGNFAAVLEDRGSMVVSAFDKAPILTVINGSTGAIVKGPFLPGEDRNTDGWDGITSFKGGFAFRLNGSPTKIYFFDNAGNVVGNPWIQTSNDNPDNVPLTDFTQFTTSINGTGRGDGNHICGSINSKYVYYANKGLDVDGGSNNVYLVKIDTQTGTTVKEVIVNEIGDPNDPNSYTNLAMPNRVSCYVDNRDNVVVAWSDTANTETEQQVEARLFNSDLEPVTESFLAFQASAVDFDSPYMGNQSYHPQCAITDAGILITARTTNFMMTDEEMLPANGHIFTVLKSPFAPVAVQDWSLF